MLVYFCTLKWIKPFGLVSWLPKGSCPSLVFVWSFLFSSSIPFGRLGNSWHKVRQSRVNANERPAVGLDLFGAAFRILPAKWVFPEKSGPIPWLMPLRLTASFPCKELPIPERAVDKKNSTQRRRAIKRMPYHSRVDD